MKKVGCGIIIKNKRILLIKRSINKKDTPNFWALPGGGKEGGENMEETATREVQEEVGLIFSQLELFSESTTTKHHFFRYLGIWEGNIKIQESECDGYGWFTYEETEKLLISNNLFKTITKLKQQAYL